LPALPGVDVAQRRGGGIHHLAARAQRIARGRRAARGLLRARPLQPLHLDGIGAELPRQGRSRGGPARARPLRLLRPFQRGPAGVRLCGFLWHARRLRGGGGGAAHRHGAPPRRLRTRRWSRGARGFLLGGAERAAGEERRGVLPVDVPRPDLVLEPARPAHGRDARRAARSPARAQRRREGGRLGAQLAPGRRTRDRDGRIGRAQRGPARARAVRKRGGAGGLQHLHRHGHRRGRLGRTLADQARAARASRELRALLPRKSRTCALPALPGRGSARGRPSRAAPATRDRRHLPARDRAHESLFPCAPRGPVRRDDPHRRDARAPTPRALLETHARAGNVPDGRLKPRRLRHHGAMPKPRPPASFASRIVEWQRREGRHALPWQGTRDAYRIWLSEVMLQQTRVETVIPYYERFLARWPSVSDLAAADLDEVLALWSGLGYYARGRNLHRAACEVRDRFGGGFPRRFDDLAALPGVGRSTAAAIAAFASGERRAILDGNVRRVLARHAGIDGDPASSATVARLWHVAEARLPERDIERYTQGMMDLGAGVCVARNPRCLLCPVGEDCVARAESRIDELPGKRRRADRPRKHVSMLVALRAGEVLLEKRPPTGIWGGLWSLPEFDRARA